MSDLVSLFGKNILITGAAVRVGKAIALSLAEAGANILLHYHTSDDEARQTAQEIKALGVQVHTLKADLNDPAQTIQLMEQAFAIGSLYGLVNNASIFTSLALENTRVEDWNKHLNINLTAPFLLTQAFGNLLGKEEHGRVVNLLDWRAMRPQADHFPYTISKAGLAALTQATAVALAPRITVNGVAFGAILPPSDGGNTGHILESVPTGRWADLEEVGSTLRFLFAGPGYITGEIIHLDGGRHLI